MRYSDDIIEEVRQKNDIVDVVSQYVKLTRKGSSYFGLCPFHNEKTPSFSVTPGKQMYYCFGCHAGGGAIQFVREIERLSFVEAVKFLAQRAGMELPDEVDDDRLRRERAHKERLYAACKEAALFYHRQLLSPGGPWFCVGNMGWPDELSYREGLHERRVDRRRACNSRETEERLLRCLPQPCNFPHYRYERPGNRFWRTHNEEGRAAKIYQYR